ncbi:MULTISPECIES: DUF4266 domain-containing protein [unclassified Vibrio]|uniref:DUF4266 domain-containing protein n=1 Tax=unclassified Vibrio TaxID=2614977 RepID=UPI000C856D3C|nr:MULTISPECIES: DUF4266 domain-containing protein [unclassified Vibrio]PMI22144.1 hypothetical protein BCU50_11540 [Vibrio sp. 10N.286.46.E10]PMJ01239.1 hypothetical protein BCU34_13055 [Vibrio sp. 10N.286.45.E10]PTP07660.1 hypothetical protein CWO17_07785 [Vibrio sp. 10N.286.45.A3]PTQ24724.1 hypothetical protein CWO24_07030 [Vibrio sp. 10N.286.46.E10]TKE79924.1 DUF4266 domain-containing protein [Vibrio sp. F12]
MLIKASLIGLLAIPMTANAALELDLSGLGKKPVEQQASNNSTNSTNSDGPIVEEEIISSTVYSSSGTHSNQTTKSATRRNIDMVTPKAKQLVIKEKAPEETNKPSALAFVDEFLGIEPVKPWEKGTLAQKEMKPGGPVPEFDVFSEKVFAYKQGSVGGSGVGGGGCGCN